MLEPLESMTELFEKAKREDLLFFGHGGGGPFTAEELERQQRRGRFRYGPRDWTLEPRSRIEAQLQRDVDKALKALTDFRKRFPGKEQRNVTGE